MTYEEWSKKQLIGSWECGLYRDWTADRAEKDREIDRWKKRAERMKIKFMDIRSKAWNEMDNPTGMHMTCLSLIHKIARAALEDEG